MSLSYTSSLDDIRKHFLDSSQAQRAQELADNESTHNLQKQTVTDAYTAQIEDTNTKYSDLERQNAVQKLINEREVAENMSSLGLTDSGLNRTQQTAVQLSYANNASDIARQKQSMVDSLSREMTAYLSEIETSRISSANSINKSYDEAANTNALKLYQSNQDYLNEQAKIQSDLELAKYKASLSAASKSSGSSDSGKLIYTYQGDADGKLGYKTFIDSNGKVRTVQAGINPYTGDDNKKTYAAEANNKNIGFFSNGYQPKGLVSEGGKFSKATDKNGNVLQTNITGKLQTVWKAPNGKYFVWYGDLNQYREVQM